MRKLLLLFIIAFSSLFLFYAPVHAQTAQPNQNLPSVYVKGKVIEVVKEGTEDIGGMHNQFQDLKIQVLEGKDMGKIVRVVQGAEIAMTPQQKVHDGDVIILTNDPSPDGKEKYIIYDSYRLNIALYVAIGFFLIVILFTGRKGFGAIIGLVVSLSVILFFIIPQLLAGHDPLLISLIGAFIILITTTYLAHGFSKSTSLAAISSLAALVIAAIISIFSVNIMKLAGLGTEEATILQLNTTGHINVQGLLLGGIIIGTLGALNDVTTTQVAAIFALQKANNKLDLLHLAEEGFLIGREHILSLVNTLVLAYAGSALAIFIFFVLNPQHIPTWVILNSESIMDEYIRTVASSCGLILAVPISTFLAAWFVKRNYKALKNEM